MNEAGLEKRFFLNIGLLFKLSNPELDLEGS